MLPILGQIKLLVNITAAAAAKSLQSCPTLCDPIDGSPPGSPIPGILQAGVLEWGAIAFSEISLASFYFLNLAARKVSAALGVAFYFSWTALYLL